MLKSVHSVEMVFLSCTVIVFALGCGAPPQKAQAPQDPYGGQTSGDLKADLNDGDQPEEVASIPTDLQVPGAQYGTKSPSESKVKKDGKGKTKGKKTAKKGNKDVIPESKAIAEQMDGLAWGMHYQRVANQYQQKIRELNSEALKNAGGAVEEDNVRAKIRSELNRLKQSYIEFDGKPTGYESSLVSPEFTHNNSESMLMWDAEKFVEYLFFFDGRFWKRVRAFRQEMFGGQMTFEEYIKSLTEHFGEGKPIRNDAGKLTEVQWQNDDTYMFAQDQTGFFGVFCLVFVAKVTYENVDKLRPNAGLSDGTVKEDVSAEISSVTTGTLSDQEPSVVDSYTGVNPDGPSATIDSGDSVMSKKERQQIERDQQKEEKKRKMSEEEKSDLFDDLF